MEKARQTTLSAAGFTLICFFLPWVQVSCLGAKDSASGFTLAREGHRALWLLPALMIVVLVCGLARAVWDQLPAVFSLSGMAGGLISAWLMYNERQSARPSSNVIAMFWTFWYWLGFVAAVITAIAALWFYTQRVRAP